MKINQLNRDSIKIVRESVEKALKSIGDEMGIKFTVGTIRFDQKTFQTKLNGETMGECSSAEDLVKENFTRNAPLFGLQVNDFGRIFYSQGSYYKIADIVPNRPKFPIIAIRTKDGKRFKFPPSAVRQALSEGMLVK